MGRKKGEVRKEYSTFLQQRNIIDSEYLLSKESNMSNIQEDTLVEKELKQTYLQLRKLLIQIKGSEYERKGASIFEEENFEADQSTRLLEKLQVIDETMDEINRCYLKLKEEIEQKQQDFIEVVDMAKEYKNVYLTFLERGFVQTDDMIMNDVISFMAYIPIMGEYYEAAFDSIDIKSVAQMRSAIQVATTRCRKLIASPEIQAISAHIYEELYRAIESYKHNVNLLLLRVKKHTTIPDKWIGTFVLYRLQKEQIPVFVTRPDFTFNMPVFVEHSNEAMNGIIPEIRRNINRSISTHVDDWGKVIRQYRQWCAIQAKREIIRINEFISAQEPHVFKKYKHQKQFLEEFNQEFLTIVIEVERIKEIVTPNLEMTYPVMDSFASNPKKEIKNKAADGNHLSHRMILAILTIVLLVSIVISGILIF